MYVLTLIAPGTLGHAESRFSVKTGQWSDIEFVMDPYIKVHGLAPGLNYGNLPTFLSTKSRTILTNYTGQQVYEGLKGTPWL
jgi:hypothetical protein